MTAFNNTTSGTGPASNAPDMAAVSPPVCELLCRVEAKEARLAFPENIAHSPAGDCRAIANAYSNSITFYRRLAPSTPNFETRPSSYLQDPDNLRYVHDIDFSPDASLLAAVARDSHRLCIFRRSRSNPGAFDPSPACTLHGSHHGLYFPAGVAFHPSGRSLVTCSRLGAHAVSFYIRLSPGSSAFGYVPKAGIPTAVLDEAGLAAPHGLAFHANGTRLLVCHARFFMASAPRGESAVSVFAFDPETNALAGRQPLSVVFLENRHLHAVAVHPSLPVFAVAECDGGISLFRYDDHEEIQLFHAIRHTTAPDEEPGTKGVAFTRDGSRLETVTLDNELLIYDVGALLQSVPAGDPTTKPMNSGTTCSAAGLAATGEVREKP